MPGFNGTGPTGTGPMTGRGRGYCLSHAEPGPNFMPGAGRAGGRGRRLCLPPANRASRAGTKRSTFPAGAVYAPPVSGEKALDWLKTQVVNLEKALVGAKQRMKELES